MTALELTEKYHKGHYTLAEVDNRILEDYCLADIRTLPQDWQDRILGKLAGAPRTEEEWAESIFIFSWCGSGEPPTQDQLRDKSKKAVESLRRELAMERDTAAERPTAR